MLFQATDCLKHISSADFLPASLLSFCFKLFLNFASNTRAVGMVCAIFLRRKECMFPIYYANGG